LGNFWRPQEIDQLGLIAGVEIEQADVARLLRRIGIASERVQKKWTPLFWFEHATIKRPGNWRGHAELQPVKLGDWRNAGHKNLLAYGHGLFGGEIKTDVALFSVETYTGEIVTDLFGEGGLFADTEQFWTLQNAAIAEKREAMIAAGWDDVIVIDAGDHFHSWDHVHTTKKEGGRIYVETRANGEVNFHEGFIAAKEYQKRQRKLACGDDTEGQSENVRPELTNAAQNFVELHRHAAVRHALLSQPQLALRLMVAHAIGGSALFQTRPEPQKADKDATAESIAKSKHRPRSRLNARRF
jgi:hypothetical protein